MDLQSPHWHWGPIGTLLHCFPFLIYRNNHFFGTPSPIWHPASETSTLILTLAALSGSAGLACAPSFLLRWHRCSCKLYMYLIQPGHRTSCHFIRWPVDRASARTPCAATAPWFRVSTGPFKGMARGEAWPVMHILAVVLCRARGHPRTRARRHCRQRLESPSAAVRSVYKINRSKKTRRAQVLRLRESSQNVHLH